MQSRGLDLPASELEVLRILWERGPSTVSDVREHLAAQRKAPIAHPTVATLIQRLEKKGYVSRTGQRVGKAFVFQAALKPERARKYLVREFVSRNFGNDPFPVFSSLIEAGDLSAGEIARLRSMLDQLEASQDLEGDDA